MSPLADREGPPDEFYRYRHGWIRIVPGAKGDDGDDGIDPKDVEHGAPARVKGGVHDGATGTAKREKDGSVSVKTPSGATVKPKHSEIEVHRAAPRTDPGSRPDNRHTEKRADAIQTAQGADRKQKIQAQTDADLHAVDKEMERRAALLGKKGQVSQAHKAVKREIERRTPIRPGGHTDDDGRALADRRAAALADAGHTPPAGVVSNAKRALELIADGKAGSGFTSVGRARARQLSTGRPVSSGVVRAMNAYFSRHGASGQSEDHSGTSPAAVAWLAWGGDAGQRWAAGIVRQQDDAATADGLDVFSPPQLPATVWHAAHEGQRCSRWASQHEGSERPPAVMCRESGGRHLGACATHKREMTRGQSMRVMADCDEPGYTEDVTDLAEQSAADQLADMLALAALRDWWTTGHASWTALDDDDADALLALEDFNWVEDVGGLPPIVKRIVKHLKEKGVVEPYAVAINVIKKWCANPDGLNFPGIQRVAGTTRAKGCAAVARWEAMKAAAKAKKVAKKG